MTLDALQSKLELLGAWDSLVSLAREYGVEVERVIDDRARLPAKCRHHFWRLLQDTLDLNTSEVARVWGVDHGTVVIALRKLRAQSEAA